MNKLVKYYIDKLVCYLHHSAPMANIKSAIKRARQANRRNALKSSQRASARTSIKAFEKALDEALKLKHATDKDINIFSMENRVRKIIRLFTV